MTTMTSDAPKKRLFVTGGTGYVGAVLTAQAVARGYALHALSRSPASDASLLALGAVPVRGDLEALDVIRSESSQADAVISLATGYVFGSTPTYDDVWPTDKAAVEAMAAGLAARGRGADGGQPPALVVTSGTLFVAADPGGAETDESAALDGSPLNTRAKAELHALSLPAAAGGEPRFRAMAVRLAPYVYGRGGSGVKMLLAAAARVGAAVTVDGGGVRTTAVHVDDAAALYLLAAERGANGAAYNAGADTGVTPAEMARAVADVLGVAVRDMPLPEAERVLGGFFARFLCLSNRASGGRAVRELGWRPVGKGVLEDIREGSYRAVAEEIKRQAKAE